MLTRTAPHVGPVDFPGSFKIGAVSRRTGISAATLRIWEDQYGLLQPQRTVGRQRLYSDSDVERVLYIRDLISNRGYSLQALAGILDEARQTLPPLVQNLVEEEGATVEAPGLVWMAGELRTYLEDAHLRMVANQDQIREAGLLMEIHAVLRRVAQAATFRQAAVALVTGAAALIRHHATTLAIYERAKDVLRPVVSVRGGRIVPPDAEPGSVIAVIPAPLQAAFRRLQPCYVRQVNLDELPPEHRRQAAATGVQSVYAHPLSSGDDLVGLLLVTSRRADGVSVEARGICARVAAVSGPAMAYLAARSEQTAD